METFLSIIAVAFTAAVGENVVFTRALGDGGLPYETFTPRQAAANALLITAASLVASLTGWLADWLLDRFWPIVSYMRPPLYLVVYCLFFAAICLGISKIAGLKTLRGLSPAVAFGYIPIATMLFVGLGSYTLGEAAVYGLGVGLGYLGAMLLTWLLRERCLFSDAPKAFRGLPLALLYIGLMSLALYGLLGHQPAI